MNFFDKFLIFNESINEIYRVQSKYFSVIILDKSKLEMEFFISFLFALEITTFSCNLRLKKHDYSFGKPFQFNWVIQWTNRFLSGIFGWFFSVSLMGHEFCVFLFFENSTIPNEILVERSQFLIWSALGICPANVELV